MNKNLPNLTIVLRVLRQQRSSLFTIFFAILCITALSVLYAASAQSPSAHLISAVLPGTRPLQSLTVSAKKPPYEVFGFAPYWSIPNKLDTVDFHTLTTLAYFGVPVKPNGELNRSDQGYRMFTSDKATDLFKKAHGNGTRVVLTLTQMNNREIRQFLDDPEAQQKATAHAVWEVLRRGIDGVNIDFEYTGDPGPGYRDKFSVFVANMTESMHRMVPNSHVTVSVYAAAARDLKLYDVGKIAAESDGIFMMAYDFATTSADVAMPTAPLYGHKEGKYWYDVSTAVDDFLKYMPPDKLILGLPWYGYNYAVKNPEVKAETNPGYYISVRRGRRLVRQFVPLHNMAQPYSIAQAKIQPGNTDQYQSGWDEYGQVSWKAYFDTEDNSWRMIFLDDANSLGIKYDFAKSKNLAGVGMWALGFDHGHKELWDVVEEKFGNKIVNTLISNKEIHDII